VEGRSRAQPKGKPLDKIITRTYEGISVPPIYRQDDVAGVPFLDSLPGVAPFLRGSDAAAAGWQICQELPYSTAEAFNQALRYDLERGQTAVALPLDAATRLGQDPDEAVVGDVGQGGVSLATVDDVAAALNGIDLEQVPVVLGASQAVRPVAALLLALLKRQGKSAAKLQGSLAADPLGMLASTSQLAGSADNAYDELAQLFAWAKANAPQLAVVTVNGQVYNDAGASAVQELAFVLVTAVEYLRQMQARGLSIDEVAPRIRFSLAIGSNYFMEVAKIRAARVVWAKVIKAFGGGEAAQKLNIHARTALYN
jgi:methylmalonyl-CoA mutase